MLILEPKGLFLIVVEAMELFIVKKILNCKFALILPVVIIQIHQRLDPDWDFTNVWIHIPDLKHWLKV
jgi:hypothetical protein